MTNEQVLEKALDALADFADPVTVAQEVAGVVRGDRSLHTKHAWVIRLAREYRLQKRKNQ